MSSLSTACYSQDVYGKWYVPFGQSIAEFSITKDSMKVTRLRYDFTSDRTKIFSRQNLEIVRSADRIYFVGHESDTSRFSAVAVFDFQKDKHIQFAWNGADYYTFNKEALVNKIKKDTHKLIGFYAFSEKYIDTLKKLKSVEGMTLGDFKNYTRELVKFMELYKEIEYKVEKPDLDFFRTNYRLITSTLYKLGYNPFQELEKIEDVYLKYYEDPEIQKIIQEAINK